MAPRRARLVLFARPLDRRRWRAPAKGHLIGRPLRSQGRRLPPAVLHFAQKGHGAGAAVLRPERRWEGSGLRSPQEAAGPRGRRRRLAWLLDWLIERGRCLEYSVGFAVTDQIRTATATVWARARTAAVDDLLDLTHWPPGLWVIIRREHPIPAPGCRCSRKPTGGATRRSPPTPRRIAGVPRSPAPRPRLRLGHLPLAGKDRVLHAQDSGLGRLPSREFTINQAWLQVVTRAADLTAWLRLLALPDPSRRVSPRRCATGSWTSPPAAPKAADNDSDGYPRNGAPHLRVPLAIARAGVANGNGRRKYVKAAGRRAFDCNELVTTAGVVRVGQMGPTGSM